MVTGLSRTLSMAFSVVPSRRVWCLRFCGGGWASHHRYKGTAINFLEGGEEEDGISVLWTSIDRIRDFLINEFSHSELIETDRLACLVAREIGFRVSETVAQTLGSLFKKAS